MLKTESPEDSNRAEAWLSRSEYWQHFRPVKRGQPKRFKYREPLILGGHGARLNIDHGSLLIRDGFTHHPQKQNVIRLFPGDPNLPDRIVMLDGSGGISFDAIKWMVEQAIAFVQVNWRGEVSFISGNAGYSANRKLAEIQFAAKGTKKALEINRRLISEKLVGSLQTISTVFPNSEKTTIAISKLQSWISRLKNHRRCNSISKMQGIEGAAALNYYGAWHGILLKWFGLKRRPIPNSWLEIGPRTMTWRRGGNRARHPINAMLNYGYAMAISQVRSEAVAHGLDLAVGIAHGNLRDNPMPLVYDLMEPLRPLVDKSLLEFALANTFEPPDFAINKFGACRVNPQMAKRLVESIAFEENQVRSLVRDFISHLVH